MVRSLFWDEPETNLNPKLMRSIIGILFELQRMGVQIFLATHDYVVLKELDLQSTKKDKILFHSLFRVDEESGEIQRFHPPTTICTFPPMQLMILSAVLWTGKSNGPWEGSVNEVE